MPKRKSKPVRRPRRSPYERSLEYATNRLEKAMAEQMDCQVRLAALNQEIPYLQTVIRALTPPVTPEQIVREAVTPRNGADQSAFLARFVRQTPLTEPNPPAGVVVDQSEPFIPDIIPGDELLP